MLPVAGSLEATLPGYRLRATSWVHYTTSCNTQSSTPEDWRDHRPEHIELIGIINKPLLLHLVGVYTMDISLLPSLVIISTDNFPLNILFGRSRTHIFAQMYTPRNKRFFNDSFTDAEVLLLRSNSLSYQVKSVIPTNA